MSALYNHGREAFLRGEIAWHTDAIMAQLIDTDSYTVNLASDEFLSDVPVGARIGSAVELTGKTTGHRFCSKAISGKMPMGLKPIRVVEPSGGIDLHEHCR